MERRFWKSRPVASPALPHTAGAGDTPSCPLFNLADLRERPRADNENRIRSLCHNAYLGQGTTLARVLGRYKMVMDTADIGLAPHLLLDGFWEMWITQALAELVKPGMIVADIGANLGYYTLLMADLCGPAGGVHAFEPNPHLTALLRRSATVNGLSERIWLHQTALADREGQDMLFIVDPLDPKNSHLRPMETAHYPLGRMEQSMLTTRRLDAEPSWHAIELAKIDAEGAEEMIWEGARGLLDSTTLRTVILEFTPMRYNDPRGFLERIAGHGFALQVIDPVAGIMPITADAALAGPEAEDVMLLLQR